MILNDIYIISLLILIFVFGIITGYLIHLSKPLDGIINISENRIEILFDISEEELFNRRNCVTFCVKRENEVNNHAN